MPDREKVLKGLNIHFRKFCKTEECPYASVVDCEGKLYFDAIALLEEQKPKLVDEIQLSQDVFIFGGCPKCKALITHSDHKNFCGYCGQAVKWYERNHY